MSTSYYAIEKTYKYHRDNVFLGQSSGGWLFCFPSCSEFKTFPQFKHWLEANVDTGNYIIYDEYGKKTSKDELLKLIEDKQNDSFCKDCQDNFTYDMNIDGYRFMKGYE